jgi:hypothetical protein
MLPSIRVSAGLIASVLRLLAFVDELPAGATGVLHFGEHGVILLESRRVCWAVARGTQLRLTDILRNQSMPPLARAEVEDVYRQCRRTGRPVGEALVESGLVSEAGLRAALFKYNGEGIAQLARTGATPDGFTSHARAAYDSRFSFSPCELLAMLGSLDDPARATAAQLELANALVQDSSGAAFARSSATSGALVIAVAHGCDVPVADLLEICNWATGLFDVVRTFDAEASAARATWGGNALVTWRVSEVNYVGLCASRAAAARIVSQLSQRTARAGGLDGGQGRDEVGAR